MEFHQTCEFERYKASRFHQYRYKHQKETGTRPFFRLPIRCISSCPHIYGFSERNLRGYSCMQIYHCLVRMESSIQRLQHRSNNKSMTSICRPWAQ